MDIDLRMEVTIIGNTEIVRVAI